MCVWSLCVDQQFCMSKVKVINMRDRLNVWYGSCAMDYQRTLYLLDCAYLVGWITSMCIWSLQVLKGQYGQGHFQVR